jgi:hypothetical protein
VGGGREESGNFHLAVKFFFYFTFIVEFCVLNFHFVVKIWVHI